MTPVLVGQEKNIRSAMENKLQVGSTYTHYKGGKYRILALAKHSETLEDMVVYQDVLDTNKIWVRPLKMLFEEITVHNKKIPRFKRIS